MNMRLNNRYEKKSELIQKFEGYKCKQLKIYNGIDTLQNNNPVILKIFQLPPSPDVKMLATAFWESEIRLTRKAMALNHGMVLLKLIDAFVENQNDVLVLVFKTHGKSLSEWMNDEGLWFLDEQSNNAKTEIWNLMQEFLMGIEALHQAKIIHRYINPDNIFYSPNPDSFKMRISGVTWSLYLHNLNMVSTQYPNRESGINMFFAPERCRLISNQNSQINPFMADIFAIGMLLIYFFWEEFETLQTNTLEDWDKNYKNILKFLEEPNSYLNPEEIKLIRECIDLDPRSRPSSVSSIRDRISSFQIQKEPENNEIATKLFITFWNDTESPFIKNLSRYSINPFDVLTNPDSWLEKEFANSKIYATGLEKYPLVVLTENQLLFEIRKITRIHNDDLAELYIPFHRPTRQILRAISSRSPSFTLKSGFKFTSDNRTQDPSFIWKRIHVKAKNEIEQELDEKSPESFFQDRLKIMYEAEKEMDKEDMLQFQFLDRKTIIKDGKELCKITVNQDFASIDPIGKIKKEILDLLDDYRSEYGGYIELSENNDPATQWDHGREWKIKKIDGRKLEVTIERDVYKRNMPISNEGVIRPSKMSRSYSLYKRKRYLLEDINDNNLLLSSLLFPQLNTFYLGIVSPQNNQVISDIQNTIPLYLVQGPPGCGKTWVASTIVSKILEKDPYARILISSKDHEPLDYLVEAVVEKLEKNINPSPIIIRTISTDREKTYNQGSYVLDYSNVNTTIQILNRSKNKIKSLKQSIIPHYLRKEWLNELEKNTDEPTIQWIDEILKVANIVFATSTSSTIHWLKRNAAPYDYVIMEEAAKSYPFELLLPMDLGHRWLLIGDQNQLPPYKYRDMKGFVTELVDKEIEENEENMLDFRESCIKEIKFFEKLYNDLQEVTVLYSEKSYHPCSMLENNYRFPPLISNMISTIFYNTTFTTMKPPTPENIPFTNPSELRKNELIWMDLPFASNEPNFAEKRNDRASIINQKEIGYIEKFLKSLKLSLSVQKKDLDMVIITPYKGQQENLAKMIRDYQETNIDSSILSNACHTVDSYQGRQADIVIISLVRNNNKTTPRSALGFLIRPERLNVMFSRVKQRMIIFGSADFLLRFESDPECQDIIKVLNYVKTHGKFIPFEGGKH